MQEIYKSVKAVFTSWKEIYVYGDGELVETIEYDGMDEEYAFTMLEDYTLQAKRSLTYKLSEDYNEDLPEDFSDIPNRYLEHFTVDDSCDIAALSWELDW